MYKVVVTVFSMFVTAFTWADVPETASLSDNDNFITINTADANNSQLLIQPANPTHGLVIDGRDKGKQYGEDLPGYDDFFAPHDKTEIMPRYHVYPQVDKMPAVNIDFSVDARILKIHPEIGVGLLHPRMPQHLGIYQPLKGKPGDQGE
ncbi:MAG TPA: hypothetical protein PLP19_17925 [bacterium]|nr:hypothetical protein [bacterium]HPN45374.1 hypothetical protein [bacterium]